MKRGATTKFGFTKTQTKSVSFTAKMQDVVTELANRAITNALNTSQNKYLIALAGVPGAGKTQLAKRVCDAINQLHPGVF